MIGASAGGFEAIKKIVADLPPDFRPPVFIVWHTGADVQGVMPGVLNKLNSIHAAHATHNELIKPNRIYIAPPDHHLLLEDGYIKLTHGPKENYFRPAVDPLFRSAAYSYGTRVIGIVLSGGLDDGTAGLWRIKNNGGSTIVQDPEDAEARSMPESALREVEVDYCAPVSEIAGILTKIETEGIDINAVIKDKKTELENRSTTGDKQAARKSFEMGELSPFTCPDCRGVLSKIVEGGISRYRCHTGHAFSADTLLATLSRRVENDLYTALAGMDESIWLLNHMGDHLAEINQTQEAALYFIKAKETEGHSDLVRGTIKNYKQLTNPKVQIEVNNLKNETKY
ncbi:chemotaxis protein CheB [Flavobacterium chryseum]|uniref:chemotaxis protein CheB n=1 Tax=Flavobacterium sp. P3160 TaxID=2512113 RepID=UPI001AAC6359|nr:chemotaxis protein CheB [Flavobacterium sp. P3160]